MERRIGRRVFLGTLGAGAAGIVFGGNVQGLLTRVLAPVTDASGGGLSQLAPVARFRIYTVTGELPNRTADDYRLQVNGLVKYPMNLSLPDLKAMPRTNLTKDFQCVTGWRVPDVKWAGVKLGDVLDAAQVQSSARAVTFRSFDGEYTESLSLDQARRDDVLVAYEMIGNAVTRQHGGPVRLYVAPMYGYKSCKWLDTIEVVGKVSPGYWEIRGYDQDAWIGRSNGRSDAPV